jgi:hypothetical protein
VRDITQGPGHITGKGTLELAMVWLEIWATNSPSFVENHADQ